MEGQLKDQEEEEHLGDDHYSRTFKHYCRVCKRGFGCGRALGGHMRAHGIVACDGSDIGDHGEEETMNMNAAGGRYALRANPNRLKTCQACENCGMEFSSWKAFLDHHGKCNSGGEYGGDGVGGEYSVLSSPDHDGEMDQVAGGQGWTKLGKRSSRSRIPAAKADRSEEEVLANWLVMLSSSSTKPDHQLGDDDFNDIEEIKPKSKTAAKGVFECKGCKKVFSSHQALGGHRASHKSVKGCFAVRLDQEEGEILPLHADEEYHNNTNDNNSDTDIETQAKSKNACRPPSKRSHECSICGRNFSSGQALGGHKRCHWITSAGTLDSATPPNFNMNICSFQLHNDNLSILMKGSSMPLDLNIPATLKPSPKDHVVPFYGDAVIGYSNDDDMLSVSVEEERRKKFAKLKDLRVAMDNVGGDASPWLQMGIGSTTPNVALGADT